MTGEVLSLGDWSNSNGAMIADFAAVGGGWLIPEPVIDVTYNSGKFWTDYKPETLVTNDIDPGFGCDMEHDYTEPWPEPMLHLFGTVVFDPDYKLSGTVTDWATNSRSYGTHVQKTVKQRKADVMAGLRLSTTLVRPGGFLWVKIMDQVANGQMHWLTRDVESALVERHGFVHEARGIFGHTPRPQRLQSRPRNNYSTLDIYRRPKR